MAVTTGPGGTSVTGAHVELYRLVALRGMVKMELAGLSGRQNACAAVKRMLGLNVKLSKAKTLEALEQHIEEWKLAHPNPNSETGK